MKLDEQVLKERLRSTGDTETMSLTLTMNEWAAIGSLMFIAISAGCPALSATTAYTKVLNACKDHFSDEWAEVIK